MPKLPDPRAHAIRSVIASSESSFEGLARIAGLNPECDFRFVILREVDFRGSDLSRFDFTGTHFERCNFAGARLGTATFTGAQFEGSRPGEVTHEHEQSELAKAPAAVEIGNARQIEEDLLDLQDDFTSPEWPLMFRRAWLAHGADDRLVVLAIKWLQNAEPSAAIPVLLSMLRHPGLDLDARDWLYSRALRVIQRVESPGRGWIRLWSQLFQKEANRDVLLRLGAERLLHLASEYDRSASRRIERLWTDIWKLLSRHGQDRGDLARLAQDASEVFTSTSFAVTTLSQVPHLPCNLWAVRRLENWLFHSSAPDQEGFKVMAALLEVNPIPEVITLGLNWLVAADARIPSWAKVWLALARRAPGEFLVTQGVRWLLTVSVRIPGWADVLVAIMQMSSPRKHLDELRQRAAEWLKLGREHRNRSLLEDFAGTEALSASERHENASAKRAEIVDALGKHFHVMMTQVARNRFISSDGSVRAVIRTSKRYTRSGSARYWFSYYEAVDQFLAAPGSFFVLGCMDRKEAYAIPSSLLRTVLMEMHQTHGTSSYWHIDLVEDEGELALLIPKRGTLPITEFRLTL